MALLAGCTAAEPEQPPATTSAAVTVIGRGMIIPAYLAANDVFNWNIIKEAAGIMTTGSSPKDFWVTGNGPANGPFTTAQDWADLQTSWDPIRASGGVLFGYVHTCTTPTGPLFRSLQDVEQDISAWVAGYAGLGGIWLDEYYPRFEIAGSDGVSATFPNGQSLAPTDRSFLNPDGTFNANQVNPAGGYYDQLTSWIHTTYPGLKIIGNAGGQFYSNQLAYANLVDVTCSFEQTYAVAADSPTNDWAGLNRQITTASQLALIHDNQSDLAGALSQAFGHGYNYVYTTNRTIDTNLWGGIPPYFTTEVEQIAARP